VRFAVSVCVAEPVIAIVMLCVAGETYAGRRELAVLLVGTLMTKWTVCRPAAAAPCPVPVAGTLRAPGLQPAAASAAATNMPTRKRERRDERCESVK